MWVKSVRHCTFSTFENKRGTFHDKKAVEAAFQAVPNYQLASKGFDATHLDRFITRLSQQDSISLSNS